jgi:Cys-rich four helix bundle protein (predicted Tat secretion target)
MNRRNVLSAGLGLGVAALASRAQAQDAKRPSPPPASDPRTALLEALAACTAKGQLCAAHCQVQLAAGAKEYARCAAATDDMLAVVAATQSLVARRSASAKKLAELCAAVCKDCSTACLDHKAHWAHNMHLECKVCMEACDHCTKACQAFVAA